MATTKDIIKEWLSEGIQLDATHLIVVCDTFDNEDYPVYVSGNEDVKIIEKKYSEMEMSRVMEVYNILEPWQPQLDMERSFNY